MPHDATTPRSRRAILAAAAGGAVGAVAMKLGAPDPAAATSAALMSEITNTTSATTWIVGDAGGFEVFRVNSPASAPAIQAELATGAGVVGSSGGAGLGVIGVSSAGFGVGAISLSGTGLYAATELGLPPAQPGVAILAHVTDKTKTGIKAEGRVVLPDRSGRTTIAKGAASVTIARVGVTAGNIAVATLAAPRSGVWVASVVCSAGHIRIRLNKAVTLATSVSWIVLG